MGSRSVPPIRSLPRAFIFGIPAELPSAIELPKEEFDKFHKVLRLKSGDQVALLPGDGRIIRGTLDGHAVIPIESTFPNTESPFQLTLGLALSKPDSLENSVRMATELGTRTIVLFPSDRTVVRWDEGKLRAKLERIQKIARESAELSFRTAIPEIKVEKSLRDFFANHPNAIVMSESEGLTKGLHEHLADDMTVVIGPEGGWSPKEVTLIGDRAVTLGVRVLRVETAVAATVSIILCR